MTYIPTAGMNTRTWEKARQIGIGGSDAAKIVLEQEVYRYANPAEVMMTKIGELPESVPSLPCRVGHELEALIADLYTEETGKKVHKYNRLIISEEFPWMCANIDRKLYGVHEGLECKTIGEFSARMRIVDPDRGDIVYQDRFVPGDMETSLSRKLEWYVQIQHYMAVTGWKMWHLAVLIGNRKFLYYDVPRDEAFISEIVEREREFWCGSVIPERETNGFRVSDEIMSKIRKAV